VTNLTDRLAQRLGDPAQAPRDYKFEAIKRAKARARVSRPDLPLLDFGVGEPDRPADPRVVETLAREAGRAENRWYADNGIPEFQAAAARYLDRVYGVSGLEAGNIVHGLGSKAILALLPLAFVDPGDVVLVPTPGYPILATHARYLGGQVHELPLVASRGYLPDLDAIPAEVLARAKLLYLNYPNNPTGACATPEFFAEVVAFARRHRIVVVHDAAYGALTFGKPLSFLATPGALEVGVEVHSLSKAFSMTGWRMGFLAGHPGVVAAYAALKDNTDSGQFRAIQKAAVTALDHPDITTEAVERYSRRLEGLVEVLRSVGFDAAKPAGTFYCYVAIPAGTRSGLRFSSAAAFSTYLLEHALVSTVPWDDAGSYLRFSATFEAATPGAEAEVLGQLQARLAALDLVFSQESP